MHPRFLLRHVHFCVVDNGGIFMDLKRNEYFGASHNQVCALSMVVQDLPRQTQESIHEEAIIRVADTLEKLGLLTQEASRGKSATPVTLPVANAVLVNREEVKQYRIQWHHIMRFIWSCIVMSVLFRFQPFELIVARMQARKRRHPFGVDAIAARTLMAVFRRIRPAIYQARRNCLYDSLVLIEFLSYYDLYPTFVIGVSKSGLFRAHSWVQQESYVLNGTPDYVSAFVPIMAV